MLHRTFESKRSFCWSINPSLTEAVEQWIVSDSLKYVSSVCVLRVGPFVCFPNVVFRGYQWAAFFWQESWLDRFQNPPFSLVRGFFRTFKHSSCSYESYSASRQSWYWILIHNELSNYTLYLSAFAVDLLKTYVHFFATLITILIRFDVS